MCGIAGKILFDRNAPVTRESISAMLAPMRHRGPDGAGIYLDRNVGLGHLRLSIIDLHTGAEPMSNEDGTVWVSFNGEIYNFRELRRRLRDKGHIFKSKTDTEVIIHLYEDLGPDCVAELQGMFAFAVWDATRQRLFIARDRVGIKPLYYSHTARGLHFGSELKAILTDATVDRAIDLQAVRTFLSFNYVPGEATLFQNVRKLLPGHYMIVEKGCVTTRQYWDLRFSRTREHLSLEDAAEELHDLLGKTIAEHMIADVPVGVLLSGGVDSSAILSFAAKSTAKHISSFTVGFDGASVVDERPYARLAARQFGSNHYETSISAEDFWEFLPSYVWHMEEPVCEPPAVALYYVSQLAAQHVKVLLSGEGGDEAFAGYPNYRTMLRLEQLENALGKPLARIMGTTAGLCGAIAREPRLRRYGAALGQPLAAHYFSRTSTPVGFFNCAAQSFYTPEFLQSNGADIPQQFVGQVLQSVSDQPRLNQMLYIDTKTWLPDDLLLKADKMTMANSLELRVPLLDHKVLEFAASLPSELKVRGEATKRVLKAAFAKVLPDEILERKKAGFPVPYEGWLRAELKAKAEALLLSKAASSRGYFRDSAIRGLLRQTGERSTSKEVFSLVALELWHRVFVDEYRPAAPAQRVPDIVPPNGSGSSVAAPVLPA